MVLKFIKCYWQHKKRNKIANGSNNINIQIKNSITRSRLKNTNWYSNGILPESQDGGSNGE